MTKATVYVGSCTAMEDQIVLSYSISTSDGLNFGSNATIAFSSVPDEIVSQIKNKTRQDILDLGGPSLDPVLDIIVFGGPA